MLFVHWINLSSRRVTFGRSSCYFIFVDLLIEVQRILKGNLAPEGAVAKITGKEGLQFTGKARTFDTEDAFVEAVESGSIKMGEKTVAVLRYLGPKGGPGTNHVSFFLEANSDFFG